MAIGRTNAQTANGFIFTYSGSFSVNDVAGTPNAKTKAKGNFTIKFLTSGTLTVYHTTRNTLSAEVRGGGGAGSNGAGIGGWGSGGGHGGGGASKASCNPTFDKRTSYSIQIGGAGMPQAQITTAGGNGGTTTFSYKNNSISCNGGSGGATSGTGPTRPDRASYGGGQGVDIYWVPYDWGYFAAWENTEGYSGDSTHCSGGGGGGYNGTATPYPNGKPGGTGAGAGGGHGISGGWATDYGCGGGGGGAGVGSGAGKEGIVILKNF